MISAVQDKLSALEADMQVASPRRKQASNGPEIAYADASAPSKVGSVNKSKPEESAAATSKTIISIGVWYFMSIGLIMYNKWMLSYLGFHFPIGKIYWFFVVYRPPDVLSCT
jgi:hypothetical protein